MRYFDYKLIEDCIDLDTVNQLKALKAPKTLPKLRCVRLLGWIGAIYRKTKETLSNKRKTAKDLNGITIGEMLLIGSLKGEQLVYTIFRVLYGYTKEQVDQLQTEQVYGTLNFVRAEMERIGKLFEAVKVPPRPEEERAGVKEVGAGSSLSLIDYISKRQQITLDEASEMKWRTVLELLKIDRDAELYRRRLEQEYKKKR